jgi:hypothetical protein
MFRAARDAFAAHYGVPAEAIAPPDGLAHPDFGLTLAVHMAALVAVDGHARSAARSAPATMTGLTTYLLGRERAHWHDLCTGGDRHRAPAETAHAVTRLSRAAFVAALTGPMGHRDAEGVLTTVGLGPDADRVLADHTSCYPPADPGTVLEPLYPDRLAEDFIALCLPGHDNPDHPADAWTADAPRLLLTPAEGGGPPPFAARAVVFLSSASERWPHLAASLEAVEALLPDKATGDLAVAAADLVERLAAHRLPAAADDAARARILVGLGERFDQAGRNEKAVAVYADALGRYRRLAAADLHEFGPARAETALALAMALVFQGLEPHDEALSIAAGRGAVRPSSTRPDEAAAAFREAVAARRDLAGADSVEYDEGLAAALTGAAFFLPYLGRSEEAAELAREAVEIARRLARQDPESHAETVPYMLVNLAGALAASRPDRAEELAAEAVAAARRLPRDDPREYDANLEFPVTARAALLLNLGRIEEVVTAFTEAVEIRGRQEPEGDRDAAEAVLFSILSLSLVHGFAEGTAGSLHTAVRLLRRLGRGPGAVVAATAVVQGFFAVLAFLRRLRRWDDVLDAHREFADFLRTAQGVPTRDEDLLGVLCVDAALLADLGRWEEAARAVQAAAEELRAQDGNRLEDGLAATLWQVVAASAGLPDNEGGDFYRRLARDEAVPLLHRFARAYRGLARDDPGAYAPGYAITLKILGQALELMGRWGEAAEVGREAVAAYRRLARDGAEEHRRDLALALRYLADKAEGMGDHGEAAAAARESADLFRSVSGDGRPVAASLHVAALNLRADGLLEEARAHAEEAVAILDALAERGPREHAVALAVARENLAAVLRGLGRAEEAAAALDRAARVLRRSARRDPEANLPVLARVLRTLAGLRRAEGDRAGAVAALEEAVRVYTRLAAERPDAVAADLDGARADLAELRRPDGGGDGRGGPAPPRPGRLRAWITRIRG